MEEKNIKFLKVQYKYFNDAKFYEGINIKEDPGDKFLIKLIETSAVELRKKWENSKCQYCYKWFDCGHNLKVDCENFKFDEQEIELEK